MAASGSRIALWPATVCRCGGLGPDVVAQGGVRVADSALGYHCLLAGWAGTGSGSPGRRPGRGCRSGPPLFADAAGLGPEVVAQGGVRVADSALGYHFRLRRRTGQAGVVHFWLAAPVQDHSWSFAPSAWLLFVMSRHLFAPVFTRSRPDVTVQVWL